MTTGEIILSVISLILLFIIVKWSLKVYIKEILEDKLVLRRRVSLYGKFDLPGKDIKCISYATLQGKSLGHEIKTFRKTYEIQFPEKIEKVKAIELLRFARQNDIPYAEMETFHGGGLTILNQSKSRPVQAQEF